MRFILRWLVTAAALVVAVWLVDGIRIVGTSAWLAVAVMALVLGLVNAIIRPILSFLSCGCLVLTLGLFTFVINAATLWFASWICVNVLGIGFYVDGLWSAFLGALIVSVVSLLLSLLLPDKR
jgi:putative membrane protein